MLLLPSTWWKNELVNFVPKPTIWKVLLKTFFIVSTHKKEDVVDYFKEYEDFKPEVIRRELSVPLDSNFIISCGKNLY